MVSNRGWVPSFCFQGARPTLELPCGPIGIAGAELSAPGLVWVGGKGCLAMDTSSSLSPREELTALKPQLCPPCSHSRDLL